MPLTVGTLEEMIDDNHCIVSSSGLPDQYVCILSIVDADALEPGCSVLLRKENQAVVGILGNEADPLVAVMKVRWILHVCSTCAVSGTRLSPFAG